MKLVLIFLLYFFTPLSSKAYSLHTGTYVPYFNKVQTNTSGDTQKFDLNPYFGLGIFTTNDNLSFSLSYLQHDMFYNAKSLGASVNYIF